MEVELAANYFFQYFSKTGKLGAFPRRCIRTSYLELLNYHHIFFPVFDIPLHKPVSEKNDMCELLGAHKDPDSVLVMPNFKETIFFL